jgi:hypothetical protein
MDFPIGCMRARQGLVAMRKKTGMVDKDKSELTPAI